MPKTDQDWIDFREILAADSIQVDAMAMLLIEKGLITKDEFHTKLKQMQMEYRSKNYD